MTTSSVTLLDHAESVLNGEVSIAVRHAPRVAAWLGRSALEQRVLELLNECEIEARQATMRSQLCCLEVLRPQLGPTARAAWWGLSRCCHHHSFELAPTVSEVRHHLHNVRTVVTNG
jgi:hypothetical protein